MRNFDIITSLPKVHQVFESFFQDEPEFCNNVTFGMRLREEVLPEYKDKIEIKGYSSYYTN